MIFFFTKKDNLFFIYDGRGPTRLSSPLARVGCGLCGTGQSGSAD